MPTKKEVKQRLNMSLKGSELKLFTDEEIDRFADYITTKTNVADSEEIADCFIDYVRDSKNDCRRCSVCGRLFREGYVESMGNAYYCSDECLHTRYTDEEWEQECEGNDQSYCTEFY